MLNEKYFGVLVDFGIILFWDELVEMGFCFFKIKKLIMNIYLSKVFDCWFRIDRFLYDVCIF